MARLNRESVIDAAPERLNETGIDGLTTRKLAQKPGIEQPTRYWHVKNTQALLDALAVETRLRFMTGSGFSLRDGLYAISAVSHFPPGAVLEQQEHNAASGDRPAAADDTLPPLLREALHIMDSDDGEQAFLHSPESLIPGFEVQLTSAPGSC